MSLVLFKALLLRKLIIDALLITVADAVVYYVVPAESASSECPDQPCQTMEYYFNRCDYYFGSKKINITMKFLHGNHTLSNGLHHIDGLNMFEMIGTRPALDIFVFVSATMNFSNIAVMRIKNLTIIGERNGLFSVVNCDNSTSVSIPSKTSDFMLITISNVFLNNVAFYSINHCKQFKIRIKHSTLSNGSAVKFLSRIDHGEPLDSREWNISDCTVVNSGLGLFFSYATITVVNTTFMNMFKPEGSSMTNCIKVMYGIVNIKGKVKFYNTSNGVGSLPYLIAAASNVTISGMVTFANNILTPIVLFSSIITLSGNISFVSNSGTKGGAIALLPSTLNIAHNTTIYFYNNLARETGGAIHVAKSSYSFDKCFYQLLDHSNKYNWYRIQFKNNTAKNGGDHVYGELMHSDACCATPEICHSDTHNIIGTPSYRAQKYFAYDPDSKTSLSPVSSDPTRVCLCDSMGKPQCAAMDKIYGHSVIVHPGEKFHVYAAVVGADFGTTIGSVYAKFANPGKTAALKPVSQYTQWIKTNKACTILNYTIYSQRKHEAFYLAAFDESLITIKRSFHKGMFTHWWNRNVSKHILTIPPLLNITLLPCPHGFTLIGNPPGCGCYPILVQNNVNCLFINGSGYHSWNGSLWLMIDEIEMIASALYCPFDYCITTQRILNLEDNSDAQCERNRAGRLCGGCMENYSLAIGSSHCLHCPNNNHLVLLIFFAAVGFVLVFFVVALNLTVTQGLINGLVFYANILWTYQSILFLQKNINSSQFFTVLRVFVAWLNLDFGIQVCFVKGLNAFWKTWLQYAFPFYIWSIAGVIICCSRYSTRITNLFGNRAVSLLATLFLLSYAKLLRNIITSIGFTPLNIFGHNSSSILTVWSLDGHYAYCQFPHILLFITAVAIFVFLWLPYTLLLLLMQWLQKISHLKLLRWIPRYKPVYDAHFAPLKDKHQYWFGVLLLVRGVLLVVFASTYSMYPTVNYLLLLIMPALLLCYANYNHVYKARLVQLAENYFFISLIVLGGTKMVNQNMKHAVVYGSIFITLVAFCGVVICSCVVQIVKLRSIIVESDTKIISNTPTQKNDSLNDAQLWDSILDEAEPLLKVDQTA